MSDLSNGVLRDKRVFHVDSPDWIEKYNYQRTLFLYPVLSVSCQC